MNEDGEDDLYLDWLSDHDQYIRDDFIEERQMEYEEYCRQRFNERHQEE
jgi:hypothetical protein